MVLIMAKILMVMENRLFGMKINQQQINEMFLWPVLYAHKK